MLTSAATMVLMLVVPGVMFQFTSANLNAFVVLGLVGTWLLDHLAEELALCKRYGKPMFLIGVGANERAALDHPHARAVLEYASHVWTRDEQSTEWLSEICGAAKVTGGYRLPACHVIHTVGPIWRGGMSGEPETMASCYRACLAIALERRLATIAFPAISTGIYGFPREPAAEIAVAAIARHVVAEAFPEAVILVCFDAATQTAYEAALDKI